MRFFAILLSIFFWSSCVQAQTTNKALYRCLPCGNSCDKDEYSTQGKCSHCGMQLVPDSTITFREIPPAAVCDYIQQHPQTVLLDVRTKAEYDGAANPNFGTLKGAINLPVQELSQRLSELEKYKDKEILVFCSHSHRSPQAAYLLTQHGFHHVVNLSGGMSVVGNVPCQQK